MNRYPRNQLRTVKELMTGKGIERLSAIAARTGVTEAALIRMATDEFLSHVETTKSITISATILTADGGQ